MNERPEVDVSSCWFDVTDKETGDLIIRTQDYEQAFYIRDKYEGEAIVTVNATLDVQLLAQQLNLTEGEHGIGTGEPSS